jgi:hypothetical protein
MGMGDPPFLSNFLLLQMFNNANPGYIKAFAEAAADQQAPQ